MRATFEIRDGAIVETGEGRAPIHLYVAPDEAERRHLVEALRLDPVDLDSALDPDEISRVEYLPDRLSLIWKRPKNATVDRELRFDVSSLGMFLDAERLVIVLSEGPHPFQAKEFKGVSTTSDIVLRFLLHTVRHYLGHLKVIKQVSSELERKISASMENRYLLQMFALGESLIYYLNAIEANGAVLMKVRGTPGRLPFFRPESELLDDLILDNQQCARQAQIYSSILSGLMDARGTIVNNNMNILLKNLTVINVIFLPLNLLASIGGMSEFTMMTQGMDWRVAYALFILVMAVLAWVTWLVLVRVMERDRRPRRGRR
jgi:magnesium transporter